MSPQNTLLGLTILGDVIDDLIPLAVGLRAAAGLGADRLNRFAHNF